LKSIYEHKTAHGMNNALTPGGEGLHLSFTIFPQPFRLPTKYQHQPED
jgi:hypothetical protein